jgi:hypothetical protein
VAKLAWVGFREELLRTGGALARVLRLKVGDGGAAGAMPSLVRSGLKRLAYAFLCLDLGSACNFFY